MGRKQSRERIKQITVLFDEFSDALAVFFKVVVL
jgi:hypothetical protein